MNKVSPSCEAVKECAHVQHVKLLWRDSLVRFKQIKIHVPGLIEKKNLMKELFSKV